MGLKEVLTDLNGLISNGIIEDYAICGGYACTFYKVSMPTYDLDVLIILASDDDFHRLYEHYRKINAKIENIYIYIEGMPVQFLPNISSLHHEAIQKAPIIQFEGVASKFVSVEYLIALLLTAYRPKDRIRVESLLKQADKKILEDILWRFGDGQLYKRYTEILAGKNTT